MLIPDPAYREGLSAFTRHQSLYQGLERRLIWAATLESLPFRRLKLEAFASIRRLTAAELSDLLAQEGREAEEFFDFFVGFFTESPSWNDLDASDSMWRTELLVDESTVVLPLEIQRIARPNPNVRALYPYLGSFSRAYRVRFPRKGEGGVPLVGPGATTLTLRVSSAVAHGHLSWPTSLLGEADPAGLAPP